MTLLFFFVNLINVYNYIYLMFPWEDIRLSDMIFYFLLYCDGNVGAAGEKKLGDPYMSSAEAFIEF